MRNKQESTDILRENTEDIYAYRSSNTACRADRRRTADAGTVGASSDHGAGLGPTRAPRSGVCLDQDQRGDRCHGRRHATNGGALAASLRPEATAGAAG